MLITTMTRNPVVLPLATITRAVSNPSGGWNVTDAQGEEHFVDNVAWEVAVEGTPASMMPAAPGTYLLNPGVDEGKPIAWRTNVLGWMVCADTEVRPVVLDMSALEKKWDVLHPDGRVERSDGTSWDSLEDWMSTEAAFEEAA
jgi:hypothetical protein